MPSAIQILRQEFGSSRNIMTPEIIARAKLHPAVAFELARGEGLRGSQLWGVTVAGHDGAGQTYRACQGWSQVFRSRDEAQRHIDFVGFVCRGRDARELASLLTDLSAIGRARLAKWRANWQASR